ncbi:hypothetical protein ACWDBO_14280 [Streptomyces mirabilis]|uniref:hypothetical protein n=1 Tax=Streptomyces mirabilis TaxID=68239 RepID=UPI003320E76C
MDSADVIADVSDILVHALTAAVRESDVHARVRLVEAPPRPEASRAVAHPSRPRRDYTCRARRGQEISGLFFTMRWV